MRILLVSHSASDPDAGASRVYHILQQGLTEKGHLTKTLHLDDFNIPRLAKRAVIRILLPQAASRRAGLESISQFDIVMCSNGMLYPLFNKLKSKPGRTTLFVNHLHGLSYFDYQAIVTERMRGHLSQSMLNRLITGPLPLRWDHLGSLFSDLTIVQNSRDLDFLRERKVARLVSIPLSVHPDILNAAGTAPPPEKRDPNKLLWFGSWTERKGAHYLPAAFAAISQKKPDAHLTIGGAGLSEARIKSDFPLELHPRIKILPRLSRTEHISVLGTHSIFLFPSLSEGFGYALLEALSMGLAAVTTQIGMGADMLRDGCNCRIVPPANSTQLAEATVDLMTDDSTREQIACNGSRLASQFTTSRFIDSYEKTFKHFHSRLNDHLKQQPGQDFECTNP